MPKGFYVDPDIKFDVAKLQSALAEVDSKVARHHHWVKETSMPFA